MPPRNRGPAPAAKRGRAEMADDDFEAMERSILKRALRFRWILFNIFNKHPTTASNTTIATTTIGPFNRSKCFERAITLPIIELQNAKYNVVHVSDAELNKFMQIGRIQIKNGQLILKDSVQQE